MESIYVDTDGSSMGSVMNTVCYGGKNMNRVLTISSNVPIAVFTVDQKSISVHAKCHSKIEH